MNTIVKKEIEALERIHDRNFSPLDEGYISVYTINCAGHQLLYMYIDCYQMWRDGCGLPDVVKNRGKINYKKSWNVDLWERCHCVVANDFVAHRRHYRELMVNARRVELKAMETFRPLISNPASWAARA